MTDQVVTLRISADGRAAIEAVRKVDEALGGVGRTGKKGGRQAASGLGQAAKSAGGLSDQLDRARKSADRTFGATRRGLDSISTQLRQFRNLLGIGALLQGARTVSGMTDQYTNMVSQLKIVTSTAREATVAQQKLFDLAQRTRSALSSTGDLYVKLARSIDAPQEKLLQLTETINQSFVVSGAGAAEAAAAIQQLSQGLASGALRGDEFNSVAEQAPILMDLLADATGRTRGELRELAAQGGITTDLLVSALSEGAASVQAQYDQMQLTIGGAWQQLTNAVTQFVGESGKASGVSRTLADAIHLVAEHFETIVTVIGVAVLVWLAKMAVQLTAQAALWATNTAEAIAYQAALARMAGANVAVSTGLGAISTGLGRVGKALPKIVGGLAAASAATLAAKIAVDAYFDALDQGSTRNLDLMKSVNDLTQSVIAYRKQLSGAADDLTKMPDISAMLGTRVDLTKRLEEVQARLNKTQGQLADSGRDVWETYKQTGSIMGLLVDTTINRFSPSQKAARKEVDQLKESAALLKRALHSLDETTINVASSFSSGLPDALDQALVKFRTANGIIETFNAAISAFKGIAGSIGAASKGQRLLNTLKQMTEANRKSTAAIEASKLSHVERAKAIIKEVEAYAALDKATDSGRATLAEWSSNLLASARAADAAEASVARATDATDELASSLDTLQDTVANQIAGFIEDVQQDLWDFGDTAQTVAEQSGQSFRDIGREANRMDRIVDSSAQSMADAFAGWMTRTLGKGHSFFDQMVDLTTQMVAQMIAQFAKMKIFGPLLRSIFGAGSGGGFAMAGGGGGGVWTNIVQSGIGKLFGQAFDGAFSAGGFDWTSGSSWLNAGKTLWQGFSNGFSTQFGGYTGFGSSLFGAWSNAGVTPWAMGGYAGPMPGIGAPLGASTYTPTALGYGMGALGGLYAGYNRYQSGGGVLGGLAYGIGTAGLAGGIGGVLAAGSLSGFAGGLAGGLGATAAAGAGLTGLAAAIPVIGWVALIAMVVDMIAGGKLFGTKFAPNGVQRTTIGLGGDQPSVLAEYEVEKERSLFRGRKWAWRTAEDIPDELAEAAQKLYDSILGIMTDAANRLATDVPPMIDASLQILTKDGDAEKWIVEYMGRTWEEATQEAATKRIGAESIIAVIDSWLGYAADVVTSGGGTGTGGRGGIGGDPRETDIFAALRMREDEGSLGGGGVGPSGGVPDIAGEASAIAERWRDNADLLMEGATLLLAAAVDIQKGVSLLGHGGPGALTKIADLVAELADAGESMVQTYVRLQQQTVAFRQMMGLAGIEINKTGEETVRYADALAAAFGGVQAMTQAMTAFAQAFYGADELAQNQIAMLRQTVNSQLQALGLEADSSMSQFLAAFESVAGAVSPEELAKWVNAGNALAQLAQMLGQIAAKKQQAAMQLAQMIEQLEVANGAATDQPWARQFAALQGELQQMIATANQLARAAGRAGASEEELATIHEYMARKAAAMIAALRQQSLSLVDQLYGSGGTTETVEGLNAQIEALQNASSGAGSAISGAVDTINNSVNLLLGTLSPYKDAQKLEIAKQMYLTGQASAEQVLEIGRRLKGSGADYNSLFEWVMANQQAGAAQTGGPQTGGASVDNSEQIAELIARRDELLETQAEREAAQRLLMAQQLADNVAMMATVTGDSFAQIAESLGFDLDQLATDLGVEDIGAYLTALQEQDLPGALGAVGDTIVNALRDLGSELIEAITGNPINDAADIVRVALTNLGIDYIEPRRDNALPAQPDTSVIMGTPSGARPVTWDGFTPDSPLFTQDPRLHDGVAALQAKLDAVSARLDALGEVGGTIAGNTARTAEATEEAAEAQDALARDLASQRLGQPESRRMGVLA